MKKGRQSPHARQMDGRRTRGPSGATTSPSYHPGPSRRVPRPPSPRFVSDTDVERLKPPGWLATGCIARSSTVLLYGPPGVYKSFTATGLAYSVATGRRWLGLEVAQGWPVYVAAEGKAGLGARSRAWKEANSFVGSAGVLFYPDVLDMGGATSEVDRFISDLRNVKPTLVVIDTVARCLAGGDENSSQDMGHLVAAADRIRKKLGAPVVLIHHTDKKGQSERGSSALRGAMDTVIAMRKRGELVEFKCEKQKDAEPFSTMYLRPRVIQLGPDVSSCVVEVAKGARPSLGGDITEKGWTALRALQSLGEGGAMSAPWRKETGFKEKTYHNVKNRLLELELITGGRNEPFKLTATAKGLLDDGHGSGTSPTAATAPPFRGAGQVAVGEVGTGKKRPVSMRPENAESEDEG